MPSIDILGILARLFSGGDPAPGSKVEHARVRIQSYEMDARRTWMHLLIAIFLLFSQQAAFAHAVTHLGSPATQDQQLPHGKVCDQCIQCAQLGSALTNSHPVCDWVAGHAPQHPAPTASAHVPEPLRCFLSRAPPALS